MAKAIQIHTVGGPDALVYEDVEPVAAGAGEAVVRIEACGVNFIDVYHRTGLYPVATPFTPGMEGAGVVESIGAGVTDVKPGDRVAYAMQLGSYREQVAVPAWKLVKLPAKVSSSDAAAAMLQGMTAHYLCRSTFPVQAGQDVLVHAAAGGVGLLLVQMLKSLGARVFGTVSTEAKADKAREAGVDVVIRYTQEDFAEVIREHTEGVHVAYDSVGVTTWEKSLSLLRPRGMLVLYGQSAGPVPPFDPAVLAKQGSVFLTRPSLAHYASDKGEVQHRAGEVLEAIGDGSLRLTIDRELPLAEAGKAHELLEGRKTIGKLVLRT